MSPSIKRVASAVLLGLAAGGAGIAGVGGGGGANGLGAQELPQAQAAAIWGLETAEYANRPKQG